MKIFLLILFVSISAFSVYTVEDLKNSNQSFKDKLTLKQEEINLKNIEIDSLKLSLNDAHEVNAMLFTEAIGVTDRYNDLKNKKVKKCGR